MIVSITTNHGQIKLELFADKTPKTVENFLQYINDGAYDNTIFHRVINSFMIQGGGYSAEFTPADSRDPIENESPTGISNTRGTIAMARTNDPHSAKNQFFINLLDNKFLNHSDKSPEGWGYCAFGQIVEGLDIADSIAQVSTTSQFGHDDVPEQAVIIESITVVEDTEDFSASPTTNEANEANEA